jgi:high-affinity iron transporter
VRRRALAILAAAAALAAAHGTLAATAGGQAAAAARSARAGVAEPWQAADALHRGLFAAQEALIVDSPREAEAAVRRARAAYRGDLRTGIRRAAPASDAALQAQLAAAARAARAGDAPRLAAARGGARAAVLAGSFAVTVQAAGAGDAEQAQRWLLLREFRTATRFTRPGADGTVAVKQLARGRTSAAAARAAVTKDLLDAYQARLRELLGDSAAAAERGFATRRAETAAQAAGYWRNLAERYRADRGPASAAEADAAFTRLRASAIRGDDEALAAARAAVDKALDGFTAAPFTPAESARRAQQLLRFLALVPVEYGRGVKDERVTLDFEIQEAIAFQSGAAAAFGDLQDQLAKRDRARTLQVKDGLAKLGATVNDAAAPREGVAPADDVQAATDRLEDALGAIMPPAWKEPTDESDYDLIALTLDRMEAAAGAGRWGQAEQARLEAYAFFEFGPERRLQSFDPGLATDVEGLVWYGEGSTPGLAELIAKRAPRRALRETRLVLDERLEEAKATLGDGASKATVVTNAAMIVFREGLEAVLILAAITASFVGVRRRQRRPVMIGAALGLLASVVTWVLAQTLLQSLERYGEKLEAVVGLIAIGVLLLITNWFFHRVYWSEWIAKFHRRRKALMAGGGAATLGLGLLGLTSVYREGFETVLFLQSLELSAGTTTVLEGAGLGLALTLGVALLTFALQRKLPYKRMLIVTGGMIGFVLIVMVGQTARTVQGTGWLSITPIEWDAPAWLGLWFGVFPTVETLGAQVAAAAFVLGSYFLAQELKVKRPRRRAARRAAVAEPLAAPAGAGRGAGAGGPAEDPAPDEVGVR